MKMKNPKEWWYKVEVTIEVKMKQLKKENEIWRIKKWELNVEGKQMKVKLKIVNEQDNSENKQKDSEMKKHRIMTRPLMVPRPSDK